MNDQERERRRAGVGAYARKYAAAIRRRTGCAVGRRLDGGSYGEVYALGPGRALKITVDPVEARVMSTPALRTGELKHIVRVFDVFSLDARTWGIVLERLTRLSAREDRRLHDLLQALGILSGDRWLHHDSLLLPWAEFAERKYRASMRRRGWTDDLLTADKRARKFQLDKIFDDLYAAGIDFQDYHAGNIMKRRGEYVVIDLGWRSQARGAPVRITPVTARRGGKRRAAYVGALAAVVWRLTR